MGEVYCNFEILATNLNFFYHIIQSDLIPYLIFFYLVKLYLLFPSYSYLALNLFFLINITRVSCK